MTLLSNPNDLALPRPSRARRRLALAGLAVFVLLVFVITPPLLNVNRLQRRIASSMSQSLGRPVHMDRVSLHILPMPGFTIENLVVSEDPAFGYEPVIRANTVEASLRPSSLWRRQVEFSTLRFVEPSLNLVRNREGQWNLQSLLSRAAAVPSAPTAQTAAGPAPRFPYIEATGGRVNLKLGDEKEPFSLTEADFALWQPSLQRWNVRLEGRPARTDLTAPDTGTLELEGSLDRTGTSTAPLDLHATWKKAQLGDATRVLFGQDAGWRGTATLETSLIGSMATADLKALLHVQELRRSDFVPSRLLEYYLDCNAAADLPTADLRHPTCALTTGKPGTGNSPQPAINAVADSIDLTHLGSPYGIAGLRLGSGGFPESWLLDWARLFSRRIPESVTAEGKLRGSLLLTAAQPHVWVGSLTGDAAKTYDGAFTLTSDAAGLTLSPWNLAASAKAPPLVLSGELDAQRYTFDLNGTATQEELQDLRMMLPPLAEGFDAFLLPATDAKLLKLSVRCIRVWSMPQTCSALEPEPAPRRHR